MLHWPPVQPQAPRRSSPLPRLQLLRKSPRRSSSASVSGSFWEKRGSGGGGKPGWFDLQAPEGNDYIELLPFADVPSPADTKWSALCLSLFCQSYIARFGHEKIENGERCRRHPREE